MSLLKKLAISFIILSFVISPFSSVAQELTPETSSYFDSVIASLQALLHSLTDQIFALKNTQTALISGAGSGLIGYWNFDEGSGTTAGDLSGNGYAGTLISGPVWASGKIGNGALLFGIGSSVKVNSIAPLNFATTSSFTLSAWIKSAPGYNKTSVIVGKNVSFTHPGYSLMQLNTPTSRLYGRLMDKDGDQTGWFANTNGPYVNDGNWHHAVMVVDRVAGQLILYTDNIASSPLNLTTLGKDGIGDLSNNDPFYIGSGILQYEGTMDDVRLYDRALSASEIGQLYTYTSSTPDPQPAPTPTTYTLAITTSGTGGGTITCGGTTCPSSVTAGTSLTFTATPTSGSTFVGWSGACSGTASTCTVTINANVSVGATFNTTIVTDTTPPTVSLTAPSSGTVSGTVTVSATASDNVGVSGVQFKLDGSNLQTEDTSSPYSISWNSTTATNGSHTLTATARDAAGNTTTSSSISVNINNVSSIFQPFALLGLAQINLTGPLSGLAKWNGYSVSGDSPEGGWFAFFDAAVTSLNGTITLPRTLDPGRYYVFIKAVNYSTFNLTASLGNASPQTILPLNSDSNGQWTQYSAFDISEITNTLNLTLTQTIPFVSRQQFLVRGVYITQDPNEFVNGADVVFYPTYPTVMDNSLAVKGNLIPGSSFETGIDAAWGLEQGRTVALKTLWDPTVGYDGNASLKMNVPCGGCGGTLISRLYDVKDNKQYTFSFWVKTEAGKSASVIVTLVNPYIPTTGNPQHKITQTFTTTSSGAWQRFSMTGYLLRYLTSDYLIYIKPSNYVGNIWFDAVQLEEGTLTTYAPLNSVDVGININKIGGIYYEDEAMTAELRAYNGGSSAVTKTVWYEIYDYLNRRIKKSSVVVNLQAGETKTQSVSLPSGWRGEFRIVYWIADENGTEKEVIYSVIPRLSVFGLDLNSYMGVHPNYLGFTLDILSRLGIKWSRSSSPDMMFRWSFVQPIENVPIKWYDQSVNLAMDPVRGIYTMGTLSPGNPNGYDGPAWAVVNGLVDLDKWAIYVGQIVEHYAPLGVKVWEVGNEPNRATTVSIDYYAQFLKRAIDAIESKDPTATIVAMGGTEYTYMTSVLNKLDALYLSSGWDWRGHIDVLSTHAYPGGILPEGAAATISQYGKPIWNTETGAWNNGFYMGNYANYIVFGRNLWPHRDAVQFYNSAIDKPKSNVENFVRSIGSGMTKFFYYDSRIFENPGYFATHPTLLEYDDTIRPVGIAYGISGHFIDHAITLGDLSLSNSYAYMFDRGGIPVLVLWSKDNSPKSLNISLSSSNFEVYDMMGNRIVISGSTIPYARTPVYIKGINNISVASFKSAFQAGSVSARVDTIAPNVSIVVAPNGPITENFFRIRWIAQDDVSLPQAGGIDNPESLVAGQPSPYAILYSYRLVGVDNTFSDWSADISNDYSGLPNGSYTFEVKAKDEAGNISNVACRPITVGLGSSISTSCVNSVNDLPPPPPPSLFPSGTNPTTFTLTISKNGTGSGTVTSSGGSINCGLTCSVSGVTSGTQSILTASAGSGSTFAGWSGGGCSGTGTCTVIVNSNTTITATFNASAGDTQAPTVPSNLSSSNITQTGVTLSWTASTDNIAVTSYRIFRNGTQVGTSTSTSYTDSGLSGNTTYSYTVSAEDLAGNSSAQSSSLSVTTAPSASTKFTIGNRVQVSNGPVNVRATPDISGTLLGSQTNGTLGTVVGGPTYQGGYFWWNIDYDTGVDGWSVEDYLVNYTPSTSDTTPPSTPTGLSSSNITETGATISWTASTDPVIAGQITSGVLNYKVYRGGTQIATVSGTSYTDSGLSGNTTYAYTVVATDNAGNASVASSILSVTTLPPVSTKFNLNDRVEATANLNVRATPNGTLLGTQSQGALGTIIGGSTFAGGFTWWNVNYDTGVDGWSIEDYLSNYTPPTTYTLSVSKNGTGSGTITGGAINCGATCSTTVNSGTSVTLSASPTSGSTFTGWSGGGCTGTGTCTVTVSSNTTVTATFNTSADITPPTVSLTAPSAGTVSGTITVSANASDNVGVSGVQFKLDGSNLQTEDTASPYSLLWDTTTSSNGDHTLTATARDAAGNTMTSQSISVTVSNVSTSLSIGNVSIVSIDRRRLQVSWTTNLPSDSMVELGTTASYGATVSNAQQVTNHTLITPSLTRNTLYYLRVSSVTSSGLSTSTTTTYMTAGQPGKVNNLKAAAGSVILTWMLPNSADYMDIAIFRVTGSTPLLTPLGSPYALLLATTTTSYTDTTVSEGTTYSYTVFTRDDDLVASLPVFVTFTTPTSPVTPPTSGGGGGGGSSGGGGGGGTLSPAIPPTTSQNGNENQTVGNSGTMTQPSSVPVPSTTSEIVIPSYSTNTSLLNRTRKVGEEGTDIKALQVFLNTHGFIITTSGLGAPGNETIYFGLKTQQALARFQESYAADILVPNNLTKGTGFLGNATLKKINSFLVTSSPVVTSKFRRILSLGMSGEDVRALQVLLNAKGFTVTVSGQETNYFGPKTAAALIRFQENYPADILVPNNLTKGTGIVGQATLRKLNELSR